MQPQNHFLLVTEPEIRALISPAEAMAACREAYKKLQLGEVMQPDVMGFEFPEANGDMHVKGAYLRGEPYYSFKAASGFYDNPKRGLPVLGGAVFVWDATTGQLRAVLLDNGYLTDLRTGAAGGIAADALARSDVGIVAVLGAGGQAYFQLAALLAVRAPREVRVWARDAAKGERRARELTDQLKRPVNFERDAQSACRDADVIITVTPSRKPILMSEWVKPGAHVTAIGSDMPEKQELEEALLGRATVVADRLKQCVTQGEIHHAIANGVLRAEQVHAELGDILLGRKPGRTRDAEITVADLTGVGALDAAVANLVMRRALEQGVGRSVAC